MDNDYNLQSYLDISNNKKIRVMVEDEDELEEKQNTTSASKRRVQKYRSAWESYPDFAAWVKPVESDNLSAQCVFCNTIMKAEITVLKRHCFSAKHVHNMESGEAVSFHYKKDWEKNKQFMNWLQPVTDNDKEACCSVCHVKMNANLSELKLHMRSETHQSNVVKIYGDDYFDEKPKVKPVRTRKTKSKISIGTCSFEMPREAQSDAEEAYEYTLEEDHDALSRFDDLSIAGLSPSQLFTVQNSTFMRVVHWLNYSRNFLVIESLTIRITFIQLVF